jgi:hypothetical protein
MGSKSCSFQFNFAVSELSAKTEKLDPLKTSQYNCYGFKREGGREILTSFPSA